MVQHSVDHCQASSFSRHEQRPEVLRGLHRPLLMLKEEILQGYQGSFVALFGWKGGPLRSSQSTSIEQQRNYCCGIFVEVHEAAGQGMARST